MARKVAEEIAASTGALARVERDSVMAMAPLESETNRLQQEKAAQEQREQTIAQVHQVIGRVQANMLMSKFADVGSLVWLKEIKENKSYRDLPGVGTWDNFCSYVGLSRSKVDEDLQNLSVFGEEFLLMGRRFSLGYKDLRQLRQLTHDGTVTIEGECLTIEGESIPIDQDHVEELQAAIEQIIAAKNQLHKTASRLTQDMNGIVKEETKGLKIEKDALLQEVKRLKAFDPQDKDREWSVAMMDEVRMAAVSLEVTIQRFVIDPRLVGDRPLQAQVWAHLNAATAQLEDLDSRMREAYYADED